MHYNVEKDHINVGKWEKESVAGGPTKAVTIRRRNRGNLLIEIIKTALTIGGK